MATVAPVKENKMQDAMVEKVETKSAFINKKYTNEDRLKKEEEELEQLMAEQKGEAPEQEAEPANAEEKSFKKRYGDLRRHQQEKEKELSAKIEALQAQLSEATKKEINLPKSDEDIEAWAAKYPDVAAIVETIAIKKAKEQAAVLEERVRAVDELQMTATREKAEDRNLPTDAFNVTYLAEGKEYLDVTRSEKMANVFDMYYDKYGPGSVKSIDYGHGTIRPNLWNVKPPERKKRKRRTRIDE